MNDNIRPPHIFDECSLYPYSPNAKGTINGTPFDSFNNNLCTSFILLPISARLPPQCINIYAAGDVYVFLLNAFNVSPVDEINSSWVAFNWMIAVPAITLFPNVIVSSDVVLVPWSFPNIGWRITVILPSGSFIPIGFVIDALNKFLSFNSFGETFIQWAYFFNADTPSIDTRVRLFFTSVIKPIFWVSVYAPVNVVSISLSV